MSDERLSKDKIFHAVVDVCDPAERMALLDDLCPNDPELRAEIEDLVRRDSGASGFLETPPPGLDTAVALHGVAEGPGTVVGPYKLLEQIGEGGMGVVFMAEQERPVRRMVALKIIKPGMDSRQVIARFEAERQALALMDHPNIAKVYDAGTTQSGRPYFVMELVRGVPITQYCDQRQLTPRERLELIVPICQAVQHAHQKGIIHRDIKPTNVLVADYDYQAVPKVIDFGVAKATAQRLTEKTMFTEFGQVMGTVEYMSPEQAKLNQLDIDTRSDVYSLGVLLYELLTGEVPLDRQRLRTAAFDEMLRIIREEEPLRPSTRLTTLAHHAASTVSARRSSDPERLKVLMRGELDWIVMTCLDKDRNRRYESANALAADIVRYLHDEPVQACPPSVTYRMGKFMRRHKAALTTATLLAGALLLAVIGLAISTVLVWRANNDARRLTYFQRVALAEREWSVNNFKRADELLALCPTDLRGWEWDFVKRLRGRQLTPLQHASTVADCAVSPDGTKIVTLDVAGSVHCWDSISGQMIRPPAGGHDSAAGVSCDVVFSPDGRQFATSGWNDVKVWDTRSGAQLHARAWQGPNAGIQGLTYSSNGKLLACVCTQAGEIDETRIWDAVTGELSATVQLEYRVLDMALSPDNRLLALACFDNTVRLVDAATGTIQQMLSGDRTFWCVAFSPNGRLVAAGTGGEGERDSGTVRIWEVESGRERPPLTGHGAQCVAFSSDGKRLATGGSDQAIKIWDIDSGQEILTLRGHTDWVQGIAFTPDGRRLVSCGDRTVRIWDGRPWTEGEKLDEAVVTLRGHADSVNAVAFYPDQTWLATASTDGSIKLWDTQTWCELRTVRTDFQQISALAISPLGDCMAVSGYKNQPVVLLDSRSGESLKRLGDPSGGQGIAFSADGRRLAVSNQEGLVANFDVQSGDELSHLQTQDKYLYSVAFSPLSGLVACAGMGGSITIWDPTNRREIDDSPLLKHRGMIYSLAFSPDGRYLASGGWDRVMHMWDTTSWKHVDRVIDATAAMQSIAFSPDGQYLAWGATDSTVKLLHRTTGDLLTLRGHLGYIRSVAFSSDGRLLASASEDGTAKIWQVPREQTRH
jgi:WD40 repeat protein/serine/threonine protein kinase